MSHAQKTPFETALLRAVEELNLIFEAGLRGVGALPTGFASVQRTAALSPSCEFVFLAARARSANIPAETQIPASARRVQTGL